MTKVKKVITLLPASSNMIDTDKLINGLRILHITNIRRLYVFILKHKKPIISVKKDGNTYSICFDNATDTMFPPSFASIILRPERP